MKTTKEEGIHGHLTFLLSWTLLSSSPMDSSRMFLNARNKKTQEYKGKPIILTWSDQNRFTNACYVVLLGYCTNSRPQKAHGLKTAKCKQCFKILLGRRCPLLKEILDFRVVLVKITMEFFPHPSLQTCGSLSTLASGVPGPQVETWHEAKGEARTHSEGKHMASVSVRISPASPGQTRRTANRGRCSSGP